VPPDGGNQPKDQTEHREVQEDESFWLVPLQDRREQDGQRAGVSPGINLASYLRLLDWSGRQLHRDGKLGRVSADLKP